MKKVLWLTNIEIKFGKDSTGSWLMNLSRLVGENDNIKLFFAYPSKHLVIKDRRLIFKENNNNRKIFEEYINENNIDLVHIHGTEMEHTLQMVEVCEKNNLPYVISIQGLVSIIYKHLDASLPKRVIKGKSFRNWILNDSINGLKKQYYTKGKSEIRALQYCKNAIGRTEWDRAMLELINPSINYFHCNEVLREEFYNYEKWDINKIERNSIFVSQASYSLKGLHYLLEALPLILSFYPETKVFVSGKVMIKSDNWKENIKQTYYSKYIQELIRKYHLEKVVIFLGNIEANEMKNQFLKSHVFISPSTMENESNSISEAKILGTPVVASYVGGVTSRIEHNVDGFLYQHDSIEMLAYYIMEVFNSDKLATKFSEEGIKTASLIFDRETNVKNIVNVYQKILGVTNE